MDVAKICNNHSFPDTQPQNWMNSPYFSPTPTPLMRVVREELGADSPLSSWWHGQKTEQPSASRQIPKTRKLRSRYASSAPYPKLSIKEKQSFSEGMERRQEGHINSCPSHGTSAKGGTPAATHHRHRSLHDDYGIIHSPHLDMLGFRHFTILSFYS